MGGGPGPGPWTLIIYLGVVIYMGVPHIPLFGGSLGGPIIPIGPAVGLPIKHSVRFFPGPQPWVHAR